MENMFLPKVRVPRVISDAGRKKMQENGKRVAALNAIRKEFLRCAKLEWEISSLNDIDE